MLACMLGAALVMAAPEPVRANPLATEVQIGAEKEAIRIEMLPEVQQARHQLRQMMLADPVAMTQDGRASLDRVLDQWIRQYILRHLSKRGDDPALIWSADNTPHAWFGHVWPGDAVAGDNPDNSNRIALIDGGSSYLLAGRYGEPRSGQFSLNVEHAHPAGGMGDHLATLTDKDIVVGEDGIFRVTIDSNPADGRPNHMQVAPGDLLFAARDSRSRWSQEATTLSLRLVSGPGLAPPAGEAELVAAIVEGLPAFVDYWRQFKDGFFGYPEPNVLVMPQRRVSEGGWGFIGGGRFRLADDEALIVHTTDGGADYTGFQVTDPWTLRPQTVLRTSSLNMNQAMRNPDGSFTYVVALQDPGVANWIDTAGLHEGWLQLRWQNVPANGDPTASFSEVVKLEELENMLAPDVPRADLAYRQAQIAERVEDFAQRHAEMPAAELPR